VYGCEALGVEPNKKYRQYAIAHGVPTVADISQVEKRYSLITAIHVLEHVKDPVSLIDRDGDLFVDCGDVLALQRRLDSNPTSDAIA